MRKGKIDVDIREFTEKDLPKLALLEKSCFLDAWTMEMLKSEVVRDGFCCLLAEVDGEAAGFVYGNVLFEDAELYKVAVLPDFRAKGHRQGLDERFFRTCKRQGGASDFFRGAPF